MQILHFYNNLPVISLMELHYFKGEKSVNMYSIGHETFRVTVMLTAMANAKKLAPSESPLRYAVEFVLKWRQSLGLPKNF